MEKKQEVFRKKMNKEMAETKPEKRMNKTIEPIKRMNKTIEPTRPKRDVEKLPTPKPPKVNVGKVNMDDDFYSAIK